MGRHERPTQSAPADPVNCGVGGTGVTVVGQGGLCAPSPTTVTTSNATYSFSGDFNTADFSITLVSKSSTPAVTDTLTLYTYVGLANRTVAQSLSNTAFTFTFNLPDTGGTTVPAITNISPNAGTTAGGTQVTTTGTNLDGATGVKFGNAPAASFAVQSATSVTAVSPGSSAGLIDIEVTTSAGTSASSSAKVFAYTATLPVTLTPVDGAALATGTVGSPSRHVEPHASGGAELSR